MQLCPSAILQEEGFETGLPKMNVRRQSLGNPLLFHHETGVQQDDPSRHSQNLRPVKLSTSVEQN